MDKDWLVQYSCYPNVKNLMPESGSLYFQFKPNIYDMLNYLVVESNLESGVASVDKLLW
jgi:hypothetical protein